MRVGKFIKSLPSLEFMKSLNIQKLFRVIVKQARANNLTG